MEDSRGKGPLKKGHRKAWFVAGIAAASILGTSVSAFAATGSSNSSSSSLDASQGTQQLKAPGAGEVTIIRDNYGVPHIYAANAFGAYFGYGYAQMADQGAYILQQYRIAMGQAAAVLGSKYNSTDLLTNLFQVPQTAQSTFASLSPYDQLRYKAFAAGINEYINTHKSSLPSWATDVTPENVLAYSQYPLLMNQVTRVFTKLKSAGNAIPADTSNLPSVPEAASNAFVLAPSRTSTGAAIMYGDPHLPFTGTQQWYEAQLTYGQTTVAGIAWRGWPFIAIGTNQNIAWSATNNPQSEGDVYMEKLNPNNPNQYLYDGKYVDMKTQAVPIQVATANGVTTQQVTLRYTVHGPVLDNIQGVTPPSGYVYSVTVSDFQQSGFADEMWHLDDSENLPQLKAALSEQQLPTFNIMAADKHGNIYYAANTRTGIRNPGFNYNSVLPGWDSASAWQGIVPFDKLPQAENSPRGYYENSNNAPQYTAPDQINPSNFPAYLLSGLGDDGYGLRIRRIDQLIGSSTGISPAEVQSIGTDTRVLAADYLKPILAYAVEQAGPSADPSGQLAQAVGILNNWNDVADQSSTAMELFDTWYKDYRAASPTVTGQSPAPSVDQVSSSDLNKAIYALQLAVNQMMKQYNTLTIPWGEVHKLARGTTVVPVDGGTDLEDTVHITSPTSASNGVGYAGQGSSYMWYYDFSNGSYFRIRPVGETDDPTSPYFANMTVDYAKEQFDQFWLSPQDVVSHETSVITLNDSN